MHPLNHLSFGRHPQSRPTFFVLPRFLRTLAKTNQPTAMKYHEIESSDSAIRLFSSARIIRRYAFQAIDFTSLPEAECHDFADCLFLGCNIPDEMRRHIDHTCLIFPDISMPYKVYPARLYSAKTLYDGFDGTSPQSLDNCYDTRVYKHYTSTGRIPDDIRDTLSRSIHDHSISDALHDLLDDYDERMIVAIMGGHALLRTDANYRKVVFIAKHLTENRRLMVSGGGPGAMEATHLGAWMAGRDDSEIEDALALLSVAPSYKDPLWLPSAFEVIRKYPQSSGYQSLGVPTWFYGHEPATPFATHIAKYFDNSIREDGLLTIAKGGVIYTPGSAGTLQEIFQDAAQNHYLTHGYASPMAFLDIDYWTNRLPAYALLSDLTARRCYNNLLLSITDSPDDIVATIRAFA